MDATLALTVIAAPAALWVIWRAIRRPKPPPREPWKDALYDPKQFRRRR